MENITLGYAFCGSFCTIKESLAALKELAKENIKIKPIMSPIVYNTDTRFTKAKELIAEVEDICGEKVIHDIVGAEPIGPKNLLDIIVVAPCTGNSLAKIALGVTDTPVVMAVKAHLRNERPLLIAVSTNDALGASGKNIMSLLNSKDFYFVPFAQDDAYNKHKSLVANMQKLLPAAAAAPTTPRANFPAVFPAARSLLPSPSASLSVFLRDFSAASVSTKMDPTSRKISRAISFLLSGAAAQLLPDPP